ncbi:MAG: DUF4296 domain-containing protein [Chitinophagales bacterium]|nr:DUF4296 domain-containing protein [Chitinophagales bacterium]
MAILLLPSVIACKNKKVSEENMVKVMLDGFLSYAYLQQYNTEPQLIKHKSFMRDSIYLDILKHYDIDTTSFYYTLNYYEQNPSEYQKLLKIVQDSIHQIDSVLLATGKTQIQDTIQKIVEPITNDSILQQKSQEYLEQFKESRRKINHYGLKVHSFVTD